MKFQVNLDGRKRKDLAITVGTFLEAEVTYKGPPTYEYKVGEAIIGRDGMVTIETGGFKDMAPINRLLERLLEQGFEPQIIEVSALASDDPSDEATVQPEGTADEDANSDDDPSGESEEEASSEGETADDAAIESTRSNVSEESDSLNEEDMSEPPTKLVIKMPKDGFNELSLGNLRDLISSKETLIKTAIGADSLPVRVTDETVDFPWFRAGIPSRDIEAYAKFIAAMCDLAKRQRRVSAEEKPVDNEKLALRLFMVRLGLIGPEYADTRRLMLRDLPGNSAWKGSDEKAMRPGVPRLEVKLDLPDFTEGEDEEETQRKISFIKQLGYFLLHFND